jgi:hypothetical protein
MLYYVGLRVGVCVGVEGLCVKGGVLGVVEGWGWWVVGRDVANSTLLISCNHSRCLFRSTIYTNSNNTSSR